MSENYGRVVQVIGPVIDVEFPPQSIPAARTRLEIRQEVSGGKQIFVVAEVAMQLEGGIVRAIAVNPAEGLRRGTKVLDTKEPLKIPVGEGTKGRLFNILGETMDKKGELKDVTYEAVRRDPPPYEVIQIDNQIFETGIKVIDLIAPYIKGGKTGLFGGAGVGKTVIIMELIHNDI